MSAIIRPLGLVLLMLGAHFASPTLYGTEGFSPSEPPNAAIGIAMGACPGRVAWAFNPGATTWDGTTGAHSWWSDGATDPDIVAKMVSDAVRSVGGADQLRAAWNNMFQNLNERRGLGKVGYKPGEKIAIKLNLNQCRSHGTNANASYTAPQLVCAIVGELVRDVGVSPRDITCYDAVRDIPSTIFDRCTREFPGIHFVDADGGSGRELAVADEGHPLYLGTTSKPLYFPTCLTHADYLINVAGLKGHTLAGMTVCAKNHLGSVLHQDGSSAASALHASISVKGWRHAGQAAGDYNGLVDLNGHEMTSGKTVLYVIDALYATQHNEYRLDNSCKWLSAPFNGRWTASVLMSQDGVAIDSVALDFLRSEPTLRGIVTGNVDNYLHEEAKVGTTSATRTYDPEHDGTRLKSLGVHEHWNDAEHKQYSRNLGTGAGIELVRVSG